MAAEDLNTVFSHQQSNLVQLAELSDDLFSSLGEKVFRPLDKLPQLNTPTILLVSTEEALLQQLVDKMLREDCASQLLVHLAKSLPLPSNVTRPRIDLIVFAVSLHSKHSLQNVQESLRQVDTSFFLGRVCFLAIGAGQENHCSVHHQTILKLARTYQSPLLFTDLKTEGFLVAMAQPLVRMLQICAGHTPGVSTLSLLPLQSSESPFLKDL
ncbi:PREDICTED: centromere protein M-like [Chrysochloris asiatica]|uniref:Centromere protein M n=1 Tax=Chrysochloris asiatica TaxID=185453 RepID=A0A9B0TMC4_CHRAS|nr:PREDICTED: centromere protein M-like [Chrysochloris asiatica]